MNAEKRARELLAELILTVRPRAVLWPLAKANRVKAVWRESCIDAWMRHGYDTGATPLYSPEQVERAIARALTRPAPTEAEVEAAANAIFDFAADPRAPGWEDVSHDTRDYYRCMARAALGVGDTGPT